MDRPLALGGVSGAVTSLLLTISKSLLHPSDFYLEKGIEVAQQVCACSAAWDIEELPWWFFGGGFLAGILFGPFLDLCWILRERWRRFICLQEPLTASRVVLHKPSTRSLHEQQQPD